MAIRYTPDDNKRIYRIVRNYNQKVVRANKEGKIPKSQLPEIASIKALKRSYNTRDALNKELENLEMFGRKAARGNDYNVELINKNRKETIKYWEQQAEYARIKDKVNYPLQKGRLKAIEQNLDLLRKGTDGATAGEIKAMERYVDKYRKSFERQATGYRGFLTEVEAIMKSQGIPKATREEFFDKLSQLNEAEFYDLYQRSDLINRIYELADSPKYTGGKLVIHASEEDAERLINSLMEQIDTLVAETKARFK